MENGFKTKVKDLIIFDENSHLYSLDGVFYPSVTKILGGIKIKNESVIEAAEIGSAIHRAIAKSAYQRSPKKIKSEYASYIEAYFEYRRKNKLTPTLVEESLISMKHHFAGTIDQILVRSPPGRKRIILDIKTGRPMKTHRLQLAAYCLAAAENFGGDYEGHLLYLSEYGQPMLQEINSKDLINLADEFLVKLDEFKNK